MNYNYARLQLCELCGMHVREQNVENIEEQREL